MLLRIVYKDFNRNHHSYNTHIICTSCGSQVKGTSFKTESLTSVSAKTCLKCDAPLENQELLNKNVTKRLEYHESK